MAACRRCRWLETRNVRLGVSGDARCADVQREARPYGLRSWHDRAVCLVRATAWCALVMAACRRGHWLKTPPVDQAQSGDVGTSARQREAPFCGAMGTA